MFSGSLNDFFHLRPHEYCLFVKSCQVTVEQKERETLFERHCRHYGCTLIRSRFVVIVVTIVVIRRMIATRHSIFYGEKTSSKCFRCLTVVLFYYDHGDCLRTDVLIMQWELNLAKRVFRRRRIKSFVQFIF
jgi:hypothetical protein